MSCALSCFASYLEISVFETEIANCRFLDICRIFPYRKKNPYRVNADVITSKLSTKAQTTIPQPIRAALNLREGDELLYRIDGARVILTKARKSTDADDPFRTFGEWNSDADKKAYGNL